MNTPGDELLTVAQAAARLGVSVRTVRRLLSVAEYGGRTQAVERHTSKGIRVTTMLPPDLLAEMRARLHLTDGGQVEAGSGGSSEAHREAEPEANGSAPPNDATESTDAGNLPAPAYRALIQAQAQTIEAMRSEVAYLREALTLAQQNLTREQTLRALPPPTAEAPPEAPPEAHSDGQAGVGDDGAGTETPKQAPGWWARFLGAKD